MASLAPILVASRVAESDSLTVVSREDAQLKSLLVLFSLVVGGVGQYFGGWLADRFGARYVYPGLISMLVPFGLLLGFLQGTAFAFFGVCLLAIFLFGQQPVENSVLAEKTSTGRRSLSYATKFVLTFGFGATGTFVVGAIWSLTGNMGSVFFFIACSASVMATVAAIALGLRPRPSVVMENSHSPGPASSEGSGAFASSRGPNETPD